MTTVTGAAHLVPITHAAAVIAAAERIRVVTQHTPPPRQAALLPDPN